MSPALDLPGVTVTADHGVAVILIDSPPINLLTPELFRSLRTAVDWADDDDTIKALVLRSANPEFFIAHYDVRAILAVDTSGPAVRPDRPHAIHRLGERLGTMPKATICEIGGRVGGGGAELSAGADMRFGAVGRTVLCQMEVPLGILPGGGGCRRLPELVGRGRALEIVLGGDDVDAVTLERWGWLNRALPADELPAFVDRLAARIASFPAEAIAQAKAATIHGAEPDDGLIEEAYRFDLTLRGPEARPRMEAFLARGGQTREGELRVGALGAELG
ncbi:MAG: enoyl-CoA hydratase/isomerase family protein [Acidimicrobiales bacterium]